MIVYTKEKNRKKRGNKESCMMLKIYEIRQEVQENKSQARNRREKRIRQETNNTIILPEYTFLASPTKIRSTRFLFGYPDL